jgi:dTDP-glucose 4,6-dehydratase
MILVTGGAGFIGANYLYKLYQQDPTQQVVCLDKLTYASNYDYIKPLVDCGFVIFEDHDITVPSLIQWAYSKYNPEYIVHFAAESHVDNSIKDLTPFVNTNIIGTINLLQAARELKNLKKFVHVSTDEVYGSLELGELREFTETSHYQPNSPYSASKAASDGFARAFYKTYDLPVVITNCSNNYGPNQHREKFIPTIVSRVLRNESVPVYGNGFNVRDWLYVEDHCDAINLVLANGVPGERYNIGGGVELSNNQLVKTILDILGKPYSLIEYVNDRLGHDMRYAIDCSKIKQKLGYKPQYNLFSGLKKTIEWYTNENRI